jgi:hypothetical protein
MKTTILTTLIAATLAMSAPSAGGGAKRYAGDR